MLLAFLEISTVVNFQWEARPSQFRGKYMNKILRY